jgi:hypothetical protein
MKSKRGKRDAGARLVPDRTLAGHLTVEMCPNGEAMLCYAPDRKVVVFDDEKALGNWLASIIVDGGGSWRLMPGRDPDPSGG